MNSNDYTKIFLEAINDEKQAKIYASKKGKAINEIIQEKAKELGFSFWQLPANVPQIQL